MTTTIAAGLTAIRPAGAVFVATASTWGGVAVGPVVVGVSAARAATGIAARVTAGIAASVTTGVTTGITTGIAASVTTGIATRVTAGIASRVTTGIATSITTGAAGGCSHNRRTTDGRGQCRELIACCCGSCFL